MANTPKLPSKSARDLTPPPFSKPGDAAPAPSFEEAMQSASEAPQSAFVEATHTAFVEATKPVEAATQTLVEGSANAAQAALESIVSAAAQSAEPLAGVQETAVSTVESAAETIEATTVKPIVDLATQTTESAQAKVGKISATVVEIPLKALDLWRENATAALDLAKDIGRAKTPSEVIDAQSKFATERMKAFIRQSSEVAELMRKVARASGLPETKITTFAA